MGGVDGSDVGGEAGGVGEVFPVESDVLAGIGEVADEDGCFAIVGGEAGRAGEFAGDGSANFDAAGSFEELAEGVECMVNFGGDAVFVKDAEGTQLAVKEVADIDGGILKFEEGGGDEGAARRAGHGFISALASGWRGGAGDGFPGVCGEIVPFVEVALGLGEALGIEEAANGASAGGEFGGIIGVTVPGEEVQRDFFDAAHGEEVFEEGCGSKFVIDEVAAGAEGGPADFDFGKFFFDGDGGGAVEAQNHRPCRSTWRGGSRARSRFPSSGCGGESRRPSLRCNDG